MTILSVLALLAGAGLLMFMPLPKDRLRRLSSQGGGAVLFAAGLIGLGYNFLAPAIT